MVVNCHAKSRRMRGIGLLSCLFCSFAFASAWAQSPPAAQPAASSGTPGASLPAVSTGGLVHGTVKAGNVPLPGVSVVAANTLTGQRYATITDINGNYSMTIPVNGRFVIKTALAAFAPETKVALIKSAAGVPAATAPTATAPVSQQVDFALTLASRIAPESPQESIAGGAGQGSTVRRNNASGAQNLALLAALAGTADAGINSGATGAALPSLANNSDFSTDSVAVTGQAGTTNPFAGIDLDQLRQNAELDQSLSGGRGQGGPGGGAGGAGGGAVAEAVVVVADLEAVASGVEEAAVAVAAAVASVTSATSSPTSRTEPSSGPAATARSMRRRSPSKRNGSPSPATRKISSASPSWAPPIFRT